MEPSKYDSVVLSGGGSKGIIMLGVLHYHFEKGSLSLEGIKEYAGTSVGSVISLLMICGYTPMEIYQKLSMIDNFFMETTSVIQNKAASSTSLTGLMSSDGIYGIISSLVTRKLDVFGHVPNMTIPTFKELYERTGKKFYVSATNVSKMREEIFSYHHTPNLNCVEAVTISSNIPILFKGREYNKSLYVDGAVVNNLPWDYLSKRCKKSLGVLLGSPVMRFPKGSPLGYHHNMVMTPVARLTKLRMEKMPPTLCVIECRWEAASLQVVLTKEQKWDMLLFGYHTTERWYDTRWVWIDGWNADGTSSEMPSHPYDGWEGDSELESSGSE